jgi:PKD repeat protein
MISYYRYPYLFGILCILLQGVSLYSRAQPTYAFTYSTGTYSDLTGATSLNNGQLWDDNDTLIPIGFTFELYDQTFDSIHISDLVWFQLNGDYFIEAFFADFMDRGSGTGTSLSPKSFSLSGTAGNQILKIQWKNAGFLFEDLHAGTLNDSVNVQLWLYENASTVEIHVGPNSVQKPNSSYNFAEGPRTGLRTYFGENLTVSGPADDPILDTTVAHLTGTPSDSGIYRFTRCVTPVADFSFSIDSVDSVTFTNTSTNADSIFWDFGDDSTSTTQNPIHVYTDTGFFQVTLAIESNCEVDTITQTLYIAYVPPISILENAEEIRLELLVFPNPTNDILNISLKDIGVSNLTYEKHQILISDILGRVCYLDDKALLYSGESLPIDVSELEDGLYSIQVKIGNTVLSKKIFKQ